MPLQFTTPLIAIQQKSQCQGKVKVEMPQGPRNGRIREAKIKHDALGTTFFVDDAIDFWNCFWRKLLMIKEVQAILQRWPTCKQRF